MSNITNVTTEYKVVDASTRGRLEYYVGEYIALGWEVVGGVSYDGNRYMQAMTKRWGK